MRRWHSAGDQRVMRARQQFVRDTWKNYGLLGTPYYKTPYTPKAKGYYRFRHPNDCGRTKCGACHGEKNYGRKARRNHNQKAIWLDLIAND